MATVIDGLRARLPSPTVETILVLLWVYLLQRGLGAFGVGVDAFILRAPVSARPWTLLTTVYAHAGELHLLTNIVVLALVGLLIEARISRVGFHALFLSAGVIAAGSVVMIGAFAGVAVGTIGASGAVFALVGYGVTAPPKHGSRRQNRTAYLGGYVDREAASTGFAGVGSRSQPRENSGPPRLLLFVFGVLLVFGPVLAGGLRLESVGHIIGFLVGLGTGAVTWTEKAEV